MGTVLLELCTIASLLGHTTTSPSGYSSSLTSLTISLSFVSFSDCSSLWARRKRIKWKSGETQLIAWEGASVYYLKMVHRVPKDPDGHMVRCAHNPCFWRGPNAILKFQQIFQFRRGSLLNLLPSTTNGIYSALNSAPE